MPNTQEITFPYYFCAQSFTTEVEARAWVDDYVNNTIRDHCIDNDRFAYLDDPQGMAAYEQRRDTGCCGTFDAVVKVGGRKAVIGCNYGH